MSQTSKFPDCKFGFLRPYQNSIESWDVNWLNVAVCCKAEGAEVWTEGTILNLLEIESWLNELREVVSVLSGKATLNCIEPELKVEMVMESLGNILMKVEITPNHLKQFHSFEFEIDQSYLPSLIKNLQEVLEENPIKKIF